MDRRTDKMINKKVSKMEIYFQDKLEICDKSFHKTKEGYLLLDGIISRSGKQTYIGVELGLDHFDDVVVSRPKMEVVSSMSIASFLNCPVTDDHPNAGNMVDSKNIRALSRGVVLDVDVTDSGTNLKAKMLVQDHELIEKIENGKRELSAGYSANIEFSDDGKTAVQRDIRGNHIAFVDEGRCGKECKIFDHKHKTEGNEMAKVKIKGLEIDINDTAAPMVVSLIDDNKALSDKLVTATSLSDSLQAKLDTANESITKMQDSVLTDEQLNKHASDLVELYQDVKLLDASLECKGKTPEAIRLEAVKKAIPDTDFKDKSNAYMEARFDSLVDAAREKAKDPLTKSLNDGASGNTNDGVISVADARQRKIERDQKRSALKS